MALGIYVMVLIFYRDQSLEDSTGFISQQWADGRGSLKSLLFLVNVYSKDGKFWLSVGQSGTFHHSLVLGLVFLRIFCVQQKDQKSEQSSFCYPKPAVETFRSSGGAVFFSYYSWLHQGSIWLGWLCPIVLGWSMHSLLKWLFEWVWSGCKCLKGCNTNKFR